MPSRMLFERRRHPRSRVTATALVLEGGRYVGSYLVEDLSVGGALLIGDGPLAGTKSLEVLLHLPARAPMRMGAQVLRHQQKDGERLFAVRFESVPREFEWAISREVLAARPKVVSVQPAGVDEIELKPLAWEPVARLRLRAG